MTEAALLPAALAAVMAIGATVAIERWGGRIGGLLGTLPTTIVPATLGFFSASASVEAFQDAVHVTPVGMLVNVGFLYLWRVLPPRLPERWPLGVRLAVMVTVALGAWAALAAGAVVGIGWLKGVGVEPVWVGWLATAVTLGVGVVACLNHVPAPKAARSVGVGTLLSRGVLAAAAIGGAVLLADVGGSLLAGMAAVFPAIFLTTMASLWFSQGAAVPTGAVGPMMLGSGSVSAYALGSALTLPALGPGWGALAAWGLAVGVVTVPAWLWLRSRGSREG